MKTAARLTLLLGILAAMWILHYADPAGLQAAPQSSASRPPDFPPGGTGAPGDPPIIHPSPPELPGDFRAAKDSRKSQRKKVDAVQAQKDAEELAKLAHKVQGDVDLLSKSVLSKDLDQELKQIQRLAKRLRGEITP